MRLSLGLLCFVGLFGFLTPLPQAEAANAPLTYRSGHHLFTIDPDNYAWQVPSEVWLFEGKEITPPASFRVDGDAVPPLPTGIAREEREGWNEGAIQSTLASVIALALDRPAGKVTIRRDDAGTIIFDGIGLPGRTVDTKAAAMLTIAALGRGITEIELPVHETQPQITITDPTLEAQGIREVVTVGESNFAGSPAARRHNIAVGLSKFNGTVIPKGEVFSFNDILGPVDGSTGYWKELVIKGDRTIPDYGGGLCQVSTTAYRGVWEYGFPIVARQNHSYTVRYYNPPGSDATVYPPFPDMKARNDSPGDLLIQTHSDENDAYFIYYGTRDGRTSTVQGPFIWDQSSPPPNRVEYTTSIPAGTTKVIGNRVPGQKAAWFRTTQMPDGEEKTEGFYSVYEARPLFTQIGIDAAPRTPLGYPDDLPPPEPAGVFYEPAVPPQ